MPTSNPRINVTLPPSLDYLVARLAKHQRLSKSQVVRELIESSAPVLERAVALMDKGREALQEVFEVRQSDDHVVLSAEHDGLPMVASIAGGRLRLVDQADLVKQAEKVAQRRPPRRERSDIASAAAVVQNPPASNRGVKSPEARGPRSPVKAARRARP